MGYVPSPPPRRWKSEAERRAFLAAQKPKRKAKREDDPVTLHGDTRYADLILAPSTEGEWQNATLGGCEQGRHDRAHGADDG